MTKKFFGAAVLALVAIVSGACSGSHDNGSGPSDVLGQPVLNVDVYKGTVGCSPYPCTPGGTKLTPTSPGTYLIEANTDYYLDFASDNTRGRGYILEVVATGADGVPATIFSGDSQFTVDLSSSATSGVQFKKGFGVTPGVAQRNPTGQFKIILRVSGAPQLDRDFSLRATMP